MSFNLPTFIYDIPGLIFFDNTAAVYQQPALKCEHLERQCTNKEGFSKQSLPTIVSSRWDT